MKTAVQSLLLALLLLAVAVSGIQCKSQGDKEEGNAANPAAAPLRPDIAAAAGELSKAMSDLGLEKGDPRALVLTNAGYGKIDGKTTEAFADAVPSVSGCSIGKRSLFFLHTPISAPFWFALYRRDTGDLAFCSWTGGKFEVQKIKAKSELLADRKAMSQAATGTAARFFFQILSFADAWKQGVEWDLLKCAEFHNHRCGGVTGGYLAGKYILSKFPLREGEHYVFVTTAPACPIDAIQVMFDATAGKKKLFSTRMSDDEAAKYEVDGVRPMVIVMRVNDLTDACEGLVLGLSRGAFRGEAAASKDGDRDELECVKVLKAFSGDSTLAAKLAETGSNPCAVVWGE